MADDITLDEVRRMAADAGLTRLTEEHVQQLYDATRLAHKRRAALANSSLTPADEPAHVFRLKRGMS